MACRPLSRQNRPSANRSELSRSRDKGKSEKSKTTATISYRHIIASSHHQSHHMLVLMLVLVLVFLLRRTSVAIIASLVSIFTKELLLMAVLYKVYSCLGCLSYLSSSAVCLGAAEHRQARLSVKSVRGRMLRVQQQRTVRSLSVPGIQEERKGGLIRNETQISIRPA
jgi:hypothetical protein